jgi:hypothetical protein
MDIEAIVAAADSIRSFNADTIGRHDGIGINDGNKQVSSSISQRK